MKSKAFLFLVISIYLACTSACKKDYPNDIPGWLKEMIRENKQRIVVSSVGDCNMICFTLDEYNEPNYGIVYQYSNTYQPAWSEDIWYDYNQNIICTGPLLAPKCKDINFSPQFVRFIYESKRNR